jgi:hypothetical protein
MTSYDEPDTANQLRIAKVCSFIFVAKDFDDFDLPELIDCTLQGAIDMQLKRLNRCREN